MDNTKRLLQISWCVTAIIVIAAIGTYIYNFNGHEWSNNPEQWGQLGDYIGGLLNPVFSLINLVVLTYISISILKIEGKRNEWTLQELARPLGQIICGDYENQIEVKLKNCGLGPLIINNIIVTHANGNISNNLVHQMPSLPQNISWTDFVIDGKQYTLAKEAEINIIKIVHDEEDIVFVEYRNQLRQTLRHLTIEIQYSDIYGRPMTSAIRSLDLFGRTLND